jgi:hypothetical protein
MTSVSVSPPVAALAQLTEATKWQAVNTLASAIIIASGRPHSIQQALDIVRDIHFAMFPVHNPGAYKDWEKTKHGRLNNLHLTFPAARQLTPSRRSVIECSGTPLSQLVRLRMASTTGR